MRLRKSWLHSVGVDWNDLAYLLAVSRAGSLSAAARQLGVATSTVARRLRALEQATSLHMFDRTSDGVAITAAGERIVSLARETEDRIAAVERTAALLRDSSSQWVCVSAPESVITHVLAPALPRLTRFSAGVRVQLRSHANVVSLARRDADLAVRLVRPVGGSLVARRLGSVRLGLYASQEYLAGRCPDAIDLRAEALLGYDELSGAQAEIKWLQQLGLDDARVVQLSTSTALLAAARAGAGIAILPQDLAREAKLVAVPAPKPLPTRQVWLVMHRDMRGVPVIRAVASWVAAAFSSGL